MSYSIVFAPKSRKDLKKLSADVRNRILKKLQEISFSPHLFVETLEEKEGWKLRVGDYRIILDLFDKEKVILVNRAGHRKDIYEKI